MKHLTEGEIRTYLDGESSAQASEVAKNHLANCLTCQKRLERLSTIEREISKRISTLAPLPSEAPISVSSATARFKALQTDKERKMMKNNWSVRYRPALITVGLVVILGISMAFAPVRAIANSFLGLFRVQQIQVVQVDPMNLPQQLGNSYQLETFMSNDMQIQQQGESEVVSSSAEASELSGIAVRLPPGMNSEPTLEVSPQAQITFTVQLELVQAILAEIGREDISLPQEIDGAVVTVELPRMVSANYGEGCKLDGADAAAQGYDPDDPTLAYLPDCTTLVQMPSPQVNAPEGLDLTQLGEAYLQLLGMEPGEAARFSQNIDWATTLVIPIPAFEATYQEVQVDGVMGTLILGSEGNGGQYVLIWIKDEIVYMLTGPGNASTAIRLGNSLR